MEHLIVLMVVALFAVGFAVVSVYGPIARARVERFARRQRLAVTATNGNQVIAYLATTRRWRAAGLAAGLIASVAASGGAQANSLYLFAGWFFGALVAEARVVHLSRGPRRAASLLPRTPATYLSRLAWRLLPAGVVLSVAAAIFAAVVGLREDRPPWDSFGWFGATMAVAAAVRLMQTRILRRPQPLAEPDVLEADDAIRSRSLHVLSGAGTALVLYGVVNQLKALQLAYDAPLPEVIDVIWLISVLGIPLLGWHVATLVWRARRPLDAL